MRNFILLLFWASLVACLQAAPTNGFYNNIDGKSGDNLTAELNILANKNKTKVGYDNLWNAFGITDVENNKVLDIYSTCSFEYQKNKCGSYNSICDCYNREHTIPQSWFNSSEPIYSDLFHVYPTDGKVNGMRGNYPFGECSSGAVGGMGLGKIGNCTFSGYTGQVYEPDAQYKGDIARGYFYMVICYKNQKFTQSGGSVVFTYSNSKAGLTEFATNLFLKWHRADPVSAKEILRNDKIMTRQGNRNPFIDYPELVEYIWGNKKNQTVNLASLTPTFSRTDVNTVLFDNMRCAMLDGGFAMIDIPEETLINVYNPMGVLLESRDNCQTVESFSMDKGFYLVQMVKDGETQTLKIMVK